MFIMPMPPTSSATLATMVSVFQIIPLCTRRRRRLGRSVDLRIAHHRHRLDSTVAILLDAELHEVEDVIWGINFKRFIRRKNEEDLWSGWQRVNGVSRHGLVRPGS
jgi:hypothetical protein